MPQATFDLEHERRNSALLGNVTVRSGSGTWQVKMRAGQNRRNGVLDLALSVDDVNPRMIAAEFPSFEVAENLGHAGLGLRRSRPRRQWRCGERIRRRGVNHGQLFLP